MEPRYRRDDIDRIVDALLENPGRAGDIKALLRQKIDAPDVVHVVRATPADLPEEDVEDLWDNVPI